LVTARVWHHRVVRSSVAAVRDLVLGLVPGDDLEAEHRADSLRWLESTDDVFRRIKPATPSRHLVSYVVPVDPAEESVLLVDHVNAGLWLPPGGHVEPEEHPLRTAHREADEELGISPARFHAVPLFLTVTDTVGLDAGHTDVSLWFVVEHGRGDTITVDRDEFRGARWWQRSELERADPARFDPHLFRFLVKFWSGRGDGRHPLPEP
jgi:8-oxo-dGTP pyrophosphatase MutT (NUDIX family)